jgi:SAM-dependent methyltransferase
MPSSQETELLNTLNRHLPPGVDWKQGALDYMAMRLAESNGDLTRRFHLTKPFSSVHQADAPGQPEIPINQQLQEFIRELSHFLNVIALLSLSPQTRFLDVACGSGWITHFLAKLNLAVVGIDISPDMIELTRERLALDPLPTVESAKFTQVELLVHDIEQAALAPAYHCDMAILESALHHFVDPVQTLRHIADSLSDRGVVVIIEASTDGLGDEYYVEIMRKYNTLERPYSRDQLRQILQLAGFAEFQFVHPVNGFFAQTIAVGRAVNQQIVHSRGWNTVVATKQIGMLKQLAIDSPASEIGIKGDLQAIAVLSKSILRKATVKLSGRQRR